MKFKPKKRINKIDNIKSITIPLYKLFPSIITLLALCLGITATRYAIDANWAMATTLIIIAGILDGMDGRIARALNATSPFGAYLDSIADIISFGVTPAFVNYFWCLSGIEYKGFGWSVVLIFISCGAIRLARFNSISESKKFDPNYFVGMPIPIAAILSLLPLMLTFDMMPNTKFSNIAIALYIIAISLLMVSRVPFYAFKKVTLRKEFVPMIMAVLALTITSILSEPWLVIPIFLFFYLVYTIIVVIRYLIQTTKAPL